MKPKLLFYCQHVLGIGHLIRSLEIVRGLDEFDVVFLNGGRMLEGVTLPDFVEVVNLPPIQSDAEFREIQSDGVLSIEETQRIRTQQLLETAARVRPSVVVIELFPFGRRKFAFELIPLLQYIRQNLPGTRVVSSVRDILVGKRDQGRYEEQACRWANEYFDAVLVHADPRFHRLEDSFGSAASLRCEIAYTGFVAQQDSREDTGEELDLPAEPLIVASIGGGRVGFELLECAIQASRLVSRPHHLRVITGPYCPDETLESLRRMQSPHVSVMRYTARFLDYMAAAALSISMAGYNTCMNILTAGVPAILYPFTGNANDEQTIRARKLQDLDLASVIEAPELNPDTLARRMEAMLDRPRVRLAGRLNTDGVRNTAAILSLTAVAR